MGYEKLSNKLEDYFSRMKAGKAHKIKPRDVEKVISKLRARRADLLDEAASAPEKPDRLARKLRIADDLIARAEWLLGELRGDTSSHSSPGPSD